jgi:hypothetical protein
MLKVSSIQTANDLRDSVKNCSVYQIFHQKEKNSILWQEQWDVVKEQLEMMLKSDLSYHTDSYIEEWLAMTNEFGYTILYRNQILDNQIHVQFFAIDSMTSA